MASETKKCRVVVFTVPPQKCFHQIHRTKKNENEERLCQKQSQRMYNAVKWVESRLTDGGTNDGMNRKQKGEVFVFLLVGSGDNQEEK